MLKFPPVKLMKFVLIPVKSCQKRQEHRFLKPRSIINILSPPLSVKKKSLFSVMDPLFQKLLLTSELFLLIVRIKLLLLARQKLLT